jgi:hypothetical protein
MTDLTQLLLPLGVYAESVEILTDRFDQYLVGRSHLETSLMGR